MLLRVDTNLITIHKNLTVTNHFGRIFKDMIEQKRTIRRTARAIQINHVRQSSVRIIMIVEAAVQETTRRTRTTKKIKKDQDLKALQTQDLRVEVEVEMTADRQEATNREIFRETKDTQDKNLKGDQLKQ